MADKADGQTKGEGTREDEQPAPLPRSVESEREPEEVDASFRIIEDRIERIVRRQLVTAVR